tara:strand:+ start:499 stop:1548 length:1050 start_codon:yes stop_codon:yes gene_type:complete
MKAMVYYGNQDIRFENIPEPKLKQSELKIQVDYCGICATDIEEYIYGPIFISHQEPNKLTGQKIPLVTGHEITGTIVETFNNQNPEMIGQKVVLFGTITCEQCSYCKSGMTNQCPDMATVGFCKNGGFAEYLSWPIKNTVTIPKNLNSKIAAFSEPTSVAHHAVMKSNPKPDDIVSVIGAGTIGIIIIQILKSMNIKVISIDKDKNKLNLAKKMGADWILGSDEEISNKIDKITNYKGCDIAIDCAGGSNTPKLCVETVKTSGKVILVAIYGAKLGFDFNSIVSREIKIVGSLGYNKIDVESAIELLASKSVKVEEMISDIIQLEQMIDVGFKRMMKDEKDIYRILVSP